MSLWGFFKAPKPPPRYRKSVNHIVDGDMRFECTIEYANQGFEEGWLELVHYWIAWDETEHCDYRHVYRSP